MQRGNVPFDFELHPGLECHSAEGKLVSRLGQEQGISRAEVMIAMALYQTQQDSPSGTYGYCHWEDLAEALDLRSHRSAKKRKKSVQRAIAKLRCNIRRVHYNEDIIEYTRYRESYRIKPPSFCQGVAALQ